MPSGSGATQFSLLKARGNFLVWVDEASWCLLVLNGSQQYSGAKADSEACNDLIQENLCMQPPMWVIPNIPPQSSALPAGSNVTIGISQDYPKHSLVPALFAIQSRKLN